MASASVPLRMKKTPLLKQTAVEKAMRRAGDELGGRPRVRENDEWLGCAVVNASGAAFSMRLRPLASAAACEGVCVRALLLDLVGLHSL
eukprot:4285777-Pleurochrysis_carterae.AAC.1